MKYRAVLFLIVVFFSFPLLSRPKSKVPPAPPLETQRYIKDSLRWKIKELDTGRDSMYLTEIEKDVILEMNMVRSNPKKYADLYLKPMLKKFRGNVFRDTDYDIQTTEGATAVSECIDVLSKERTLDLIYPNRRLRKMAKYHAGLQGVTEQIGHNTPKGETLNQRIKRFKIPCYCWGENIDYGLNSARDIVISLLVDDGVPSRGHRDNILNNFFNWVGVYFGSHKKYKYMIVTDFVSYRTWF